MYQKRWFQQSWNHLSWFISPSLIFRSGWRGLWFDGQWNRRLRWWIAIITSCSKVWETTWLPSSLPNLWTGRRCQWWGAVGFRFWIQRWGFRFCWSHIEWGHGTREDTWFWNSTISNIKSKMKMKIAEFQKTTKTHQIRTSRWKTCPESSSRLYQQPRRSGLKEHQQPHKLDWIQRDQQWNKQYILQKLYLSQEYRWPRKCFLYIGETSLKVWTWECLLGSMEIGHRSVWLSAGKMTDLVWVYH